MTITKTTIKGLGAALSALLASTTVQAQVVAAPDPDLQGASEAGATEDVVVTARLRRENIQTTPLAISAFDAAAIERQGIVDLRSLSEATAGLQLDSPGGKFLSAPVIRGLSQVSRVDDENNTSIFLDGVYVSGREGLDFSLLDLERIEVVKGPQSALYGRNSYAGAINYITRKPGEELELLANGTIGNAGRRKIGASVSGPLVPGVLFARLGGAYDRWDGSYSNDTTRRNIGGYVSRLVTGSLRLLAGEAFEANANVYWADDDIDPAAQFLFTGNCEVVRGKATAFCGEYPEVDPDADLSGYDPRAYGLRRKLLRSSLNMQLDLGSAALTSITGLNTIKTTTLLDFDRQLPGVPFALVNAATRAPAGTANLVQLASGGNVDNRELSQELRLGSSGDGPFQWVIGGVYYEFRNNNTAPAAIDTSGLPAGIVAAAATPTGFGSAFRPIPANFDDTSFPNVFGPPTRKNTESVAGFGAVSYRFGALSARAELRYTSEKKSLTQLVPGGAAVSNTFKFWTPRFTLDYQATPAIFLYASAAKGVKAGGFNAAAPTPAELPYDPETNWTYEVGVKADLFDKLLRVNLAVFNIELRDIQITNPSPTLPTVFLVRNAGAARSRGLELELVARPAQGLRLAASYSLADAKFTRAIDGSLRSYPSFALNQNIAGEPLPRQAKHLINGSISYSRPISAAINAYANADARYESRKYGFTSRLLGYVGDRTIVNLRAGVQNETFDVSVFMRNALNDKEGILAGATLTLNDFLRLPMNSLPDLRTFGVTLTLRN
jgi:iron complex outermembrane receptor protein